MKWMRILALLLAATLLLSGCGLRKIDSPSDTSISSETSITAEPTAEATSEPTAEPTPTEEPPANAAWLAEREQRLSSWETFDDLQYERPDTALLIAELNALMERASSETDADAFFAAYDQLNTDYNHYYTMYGLASVQYDLDVSNTAASDEMEWLDEQQGTLAPLAGKMYKAIFENEILAAWCEENWSDASIRASKDCYTLFPDSITELSTQISSLLIQYDRLKLSFTTKVGDEDWTLDDFYAYDGTGGVTREEFYAAYNRYQEEYNAAAGEMFLQLRDLRVEMASRAGYDSFADYMYAAYNADYSSDDIQALSEAIKTYITPLYENLYQDLAATGLQQLYQHTYSADDTLQALQSTLSKVDDRLADSVNLMLSRHLYDIEPAANKRSGAYTTFFEDYGTPFFFSSFTGSYWDVGTAIHEFGHFNSYARVPACRLEEIDSIDLAEIDSQGLSLLMMPYYEDFYTFRLANAARSEALLSAMSSLLTGCLEDEFQRTVYANPDMTLEEMNSLYAKLAEEYGQVSTYGLTGYSWVLVDHTFSSPMYYISYALSMVPSLELWMDSQEDWEGTVDSYLDFIDDRGHQYSFREALHQYGFSDPFSESDALICSIADAISDYSYNVLLGE